MSRPRVRVATALTVLMVLAPLGSSAQQPTALERLQRAQQVWKAAGIDHYEYRVRFTCGTCEIVLPPGGPEFQVNAGRSTLKGGADVPNHLRTHSTVENLFEFIRAALAERPLVATLEFDPNLGYPVRVFIDPSRATDDEHVFVVEGFTIMP